MRKINVTRSREMLVLRSIVCHLVDRKTFKPIDHWARDIVGKIKTKTGEIIYDFKLVEDEGNTMAVFRNSRASGTFYYCTYDVNAFLRNTKESRAMLAKFMSHKEELTTVNKELERLRTVKRQLRASINEKRWVLNKFKLDRQ